MSLDAKIGQERRIISKVEAGVLQTLERCILVSTLSRVKSQLRGSGKLPCSGFRIANVGGESGLKPIHCLRIRLLRKKELAKREIGGKRVGTYGKSAGEKPLRFGLIAPFKVRPRPRRESLRVLPFAVKLLLRRRSSLQWDCRRKRAERLPRKGRNQESGLK